MKRISTVVAVLVLWTAAPAWAETQVAGTGEPAYTKSTQNTQWISWQSPGGVDGYRLHVVYYKDNVQVHELRAPVGVSGTMWANWSGIQTLTEGSTYAICARGEYLISGMWFSDGQDSCASGAAQGKRTSTTIDRTAPTIAAVVAGGAATTRQDAIGLHVDFTDAAAGPSPATYVCLQAGADPAAACGGALSYSAACSVPAGPGKTTTFDCQLDGAGLPDGPVGACVIAADAARADNPSSADQSGSVASANTSAMKCDTVILDRAAPALTVDASATSVTAGTPVGFTASASDATSGLAGEVAWTWVDGSAPGSGSAQSHVFTQPGTYRVAARVKDAAGNETVVEKEIAVLAPPASQPDGAAQPPAAPPAPEAPSGGSSQEPDAPAGPTAGDISDAAGGARSCAPRSAAHRCSSRRVSGWPRAAATS